MTIRGSINSIKNISKIENLILKLENQIKRKLKDEEIASILNMVNTRDYQEIKK